MTDEHDKDHLPTQCEIDAQFELMFETYGVLGRMTGVTKDDARDVFRVALGGLPLFAIEQAVREIINGRWPEHQTDRLPSTAVVCHATRFFMWREHERRQGLQA